ncbi:MAG TPA: type II toxin-antitoxin system prevent-host-death family antitoxin [Candidatus Baltobacteraceae bacterium]|nr:type II toxin-antitoxin system prevent-host-death family antitoxin [Candidatus Baltobacteraceae bacterium]
MRTVNMHDAKTNLSGLVRDLRTGSEREIVICVSGKPVAKLVPFTQSRRQLGPDRGLIRIADDFDAVNAQIADSFEAS